MSALPPLATEADLVARLGRPLTPEESARAPAMLGDASAMVRRYTRRDFTFTPDATTIQRPVGTKCRLPQLPVHAVWSVTARLGFGSPIVTEDQPAPPLPCIVMPPGTWAFDGVDTVDVWPPDSSLWLNLPELEVGCGAPYVDTYAIRYAYGYDETPPDVVAVVCGAVLRSIVSPSLTPGMVSERIGAYSYQMGGGSAGIAVQLTQADRDALADYRRKATTIQARQ